MTTAAVPTLRLQPDVAAEWEPRLLSRTYDPASLPAEKKAGVLVGMGMTEKQGGSDVRSNTTAAVPIDGGGPGAEYVLTGHKWFTSAPMNDAFLVLARAPAGLSCFLVPRWAPDGRAQPPAHPAIEGQAGQPVERLGRDRARRGMGPHGGGGGERGGHHPRDGQRHPARLRHRLGGADAAGGGPGRPPRGPPARLRLGADRQAADGQRGRRPRGGGGGRRGADGPDGGDLRPRRMPTTTRRRCGGSSPRWPSSG